VILLAAVHLAPAVSIPPAVILSAVFLWYWLRLGRPEVPASRRKVRRFSLALMLISLPMFVRALSFVDPAVDKRPYAIAWTAVMLVLLLIMATAIMDAINNLRIHTNQKHDEVIKAAGELAVAIRQRQREEAAKPKSSGSGAAPDTGESTERGA
jgi:hypothetical protein